MSVGPGAPAPDPHTVDALDDVLPQTQCQRCGYPSCREYAQAMACGAADINRCPPGGQRTIERLGVLTGRVPRALDPQCGEEGPWRLAVIDESRCIGCTLCIQVCPVDAIVGAAKRMHTVIERECTGCELCVPVCPVDCVLLEDVAPVDVPRLEPGAEASTERQTPADFLSAWMRIRAPYARWRFERRTERLACGPSRRLVRTKKLRQSAQSRSSVPMPQPVGPAKHVDRTPLAGPGAAADITAAVERARARRGASADVTNPQRPRRGL